MTWLPEIISPIGVLAVWAIFGYVLGSIPFGLVMAKLFDLGDLRQVGSGNIGATNVLRTGNKLAALLTLLLDSGKGAFAVIIVAQFAYLDAIQIVALGAFLGHCFPIWIGFKGGKGVATFLGVLLALAFPLGLSACATWLAVALIFRISSLAALVAAASTILWAIILGTPEFVVLCVALSALIFYRHSANISRIVRGQEPKIGKKT